MERSRIIALCFVAGLRQGMGLTESQAYPSAVSMYVEGQDERVVQVVMGADRPDGAGMGAQDGGGAVLLSANVTLTIWYRCNLDQHQYSQDALYELDRGLSDFAGKVKQNFAFTFFQLMDGTFMLFEPIKYAGSTPASFFDEDRGVLRKDVNFLVKWADDLPTQVTLTPLDLAAIQE